MMQDKLGLDDRDIKILSFLEKDPDMSQEEMAKKLKLSQPSIGFRIKKLKERGIITSVYGMNFKKVPLFLAKVDLTAKDTAAVLDKFHHCPFFLNGLILSGMHNLCLFFMCDNLERLEGVINFHLRSDSAVSNVNMNIVISPARDLIFPVALNLDIQKNPKCEERCREFIHQQKGLDSFGK